MSLVLDIGQGAGLAGASGVRPFLPPLLAGAFARADTGIDFDGSGWQFLESPWFLLAVLVLAVISYGAERSGANRDVIKWGGGVVAVVLGALLFAGSLAAGGHSAIPGLIAGVACAALAWAAVGGLLDRARARPGGGSRSAAAGLRGHRGAGPGRGGDLRGARGLSRPDRVRRAPDTGPGPGRPQVRGPSHPAMSRPSKVVLAVIDALDPQALDRAVADGRAPSLKAIMDRGVYVNDCVSTFPSITPVAASAIATGLGPADHLVPSMNWYHRGEERYVEYGSSFPATRVFGVLRSLMDTVYNMNLAHLTQERRTVFEALDDAGLRTACTTYLIYRGRHRHEPSRDSRYSRIAEAAQFRHAVWGAQELFYADIFDSQGTGCFSTLGMPGQRDQHAGCVGAHLVENDLFDFLLFSLPDNDTYSHRAGPTEQPHSIAEADRALDRLFHAGGGAQAFLDEHAVIVMSDHSQNPIETSTNLAEALEGWAVLHPADPDPLDADIAVCPGARSGQVYVLDQERTAEVASAVATQLRDVEGVDLVMRRDGEGATVWSPRGELSFSPGGPLTDGRGRDWAVEGDHAALDLRVGSSWVHSEDYPDALGRLWSALNCPRAGDVFVSAAPGHEFADWGGHDHVGGGSHGSLHRCDSLGVLLMSGIGPASADERERWSIEDVTPLVLDHFGVAA
jgi:hypothetical protein